MEYLNLCKAAQKELDLDEEVVLTLGDFCAYDMENENILLNIKDAMFQGEEFYSFLEELFSDARQYCLSFLSFLHEFGHHYDTMEYDAFEDYFYRTFVTDRDYYRIPSERAATEWAVDFIIANREKCDELNRKFKEMEKTQC